MNKSHSDLPTPASDSGVSRRDLLKIGTWGIGALAMGWSPSSASASSVSTSSTVVGGAITGSILEVRKEAMHPKVNATPADVLRARDNISRYDWAKNMAQRITSAADVWLAKDDEWIRAVVPKADACFAYGFTGCPICSASWGQWDKANTSWEMAGHVKCANGHILPDAEHPDLGTGYVGPDGRIHYFVGSYNAWVVEKLTGATTELAHSYALTGDDRYAAKAAVILDALAVVYPTCTKGSWDYPSNPPSGRFNRPWYQVARVLVIYTEQYDHIYHSPALDQASLVNSLTRRQNIEENLLKNGAAYCFHQSKGDEGGSSALTNGVADYIRGSMAVGICLDIPEYVKWAVDGPSGIRTMLDNNLGRDGTYYETSALYAAHARNLYHSFAEPLFLYRGSAYPEGVDLYKHPKFRNLLVLHNLRQALAGHQVAYGDSEPETAHLVAPERPLNAADLLSIERLYSQTSDDSERRDLGQLLNWFAAGDVDAMRGKVNTNDRWMLFHARPVPESESPTSKETFSASLAPQYAERLFGSTLMGQKGLVVLRASRDFSPSGQQGLLVRYGPSLNHGHFDDLNINFVSHGYELTYDLGYKLASTHTQMGWAKLTASHNLVVVDETTQGQDGHTGGSLTLFADLPSVKLTEASSESCYTAQGVTLYRRTLAFIDGYLIDIFRVRGGKQHDYMLHTLGQKLEVEGVTLGPIEPGSLAGKDIAWGAMQLNDGDIKGHPNQLYWNPPPGNGYGFMIEPRRGTTDTAWNATWGIDDATNMRLHVPAFAGEQVLTAVAPGILPNVPKAHSVIRRRRANSKEPLQSTFVAVLEPYGTVPSVLKVETLSLEGPRATVKPVALRISKENNTDYVYSADDSKSRHAEGVTFAARFLHARFTAPATQTPELLALSMIGGKQWQRNGWEIRSQTEGWSGAIIEVDFQNNVLTTRVALPEGEALRGQHILLSGAHSERNSAHRIHHVERAGKNWRVFLEETIILGRGAVAEIKDEHTLVSRIPHEYARSHQVGGKPSGFFDGKSLRSVGGSQTIIRSIKPGPPFEITVASTRGFRVGETFFYHDVQAGDSFQIHNTVTVEKLAIGQYNVCSFAPVHVAAPKGVQIEFNSVHPLKTV